MANWVLKFISGKYQGGEFPLEESEEYFIGRSSESDMVLVEDMVSRQHAKLSVKNNVVNLHDLGSTNGSFVNGERVGDAVLNEGDRILFGTSIIKLVRLENSAVLERPEMFRSEASIRENPQTGENPVVQSGPVTTQSIHLTPPPSFLPPQASPLSAPAGAPAPAPAAAPAPAPVAPAAPSYGPSHGATMAGSMSGMLEEVALPDLLQLFSTSRKNGVLRLIQDTARAAVYLRDGRVVFAEIAGLTELPPEKAAYRVLTWNTGMFVLEPLPPDTKFPSEIEHSTEGLMMEAMRLMDELENIRHRLPDMRATLDIKRPLLPPLRALTPELLDTLQLIVNNGRVDAILNASLANDLDTMQDLDYLLKHKYIEVR